MQIDNITLSFMRGFDGAELQEAFVARGTNYYELGIYDKAIKDHTRAIEVADKKIGAYYERGYLYEKLNDYEKAIEDYTKAIELDDSSKYKLCSHRGEYHKYQALRNRAHIY